MYHNTVMTMGCLHYRAVDYKYSALYNRVKALILMCNRRGNIRWLFLINEV